MKTKVTELLGIEYPIIQGGMAWVAEHHLAAAVSEAGGLGLIGGANAPGEELRQQIHLAKEMTNKPFGVNVMLMSPYADDVAKVVVEEGIKVVTTGAGIPGKYMGMWKEAGIKVIPVVASVAQARLMEKSGADAVVAEGMESGGHIGEATTMTLVPQVVDAVSIPVIAAGGIGDGRGIAAAFMLGAEAVQMGTRFLSAQECSIHPVYKEKILKATDLCTMVTGKRLGHPVRSLRTEFARDYAKAEYGGMPDEELLGQLTDYFQQRREIAVDVLVRAPEAVTVDVAVKIDGGADQAGAAERVKTALRQWFTGERLGQDVLRARLGSLIFGCEGVKNYELTAPPEDLALEPDQLPVLGTLTVEAMQ